MRKDILENHLEDYNTFIDGAITLFIQDYVDSERVDSHTVLKLQELHNMLNEYMGVVAKRMVKNA